ncbi:MAG TPA: hypothetical protein VI356_11930 [Myxococcales bacterium]
MVDVEHPFAGGGGFLALLLLLLLRVALALLLLLLRMALLLLWLALLLLRLGHPVQVLWSGCALGRCAGLRRLSLLRLDRLRAVGRGGCLLGALVVRGVVLHVHDAALRVERRRGLVLLSMTPALAAAAAAPAAIAPELPPALTFLLLALGLSELAIGIAAAVPAATRLRVARVPRLGGIAAGCLGCSRCGGSLSFSVHP